MLRIFAFLAMFALPLAVDAATYRYSFTAWMDGDSWMVQYMDDPSIVLTTEETGAPGPLTHLAGVPISGFFTVTGDYESGYSSQCILGDLDCGGGRWDSVRIDPRTGVVHAELSNDPLSDDDYFYFRFDPNGKGEIEYVLLYEDLNIVPDLGEYTEDGYRYIDYFAYFNVTSWERIILPGDEEWEPLPGCNPSGNIPPKCNPAPVPLPASLPLLLAGVLLLGGARVRVTQIGNRP